MTKLTKPQYRLATVASVLGILQGTAWLVMSIICIVVYLESKSGPPDLPQQTTLDIFNRDVFRIFLNGNSGPISSNGFTVFMWVYLITDSIWTVVSILQLRIINKTHSNCLNLFKCWAVITFLIACIDLLLVVLLGVDYHENCSLPYRCTDVYIPVLVIAAKGFFLWIINVIFVYVFYKIIRTIQSGKNLSRSLLSADPQIPRATLQSSTNRSNGANQNNWSNQSAPYNNNDNFWSNNPRPVAYDGRSPPTSPMYYPVQQQQPSYARY
ncbi:hypothetical protein Zmor_005132 [Zophobas morio]|uniref:Uncharacterized protein n=1 Tax=Zophobas morio TaxID=2755281 RepID=A0AA38ITT9_9CUCU|nr:hypothetical protein Zmor_005132 [Zophobas morio]